MVATKSESQQLQQIQSDLTEVKANLEWQSRTIRNLSESVDNRFEGLGKSIDKRFDAVNVQLHEIRGEIRDLSKLVRASLISHDHH